VLRANLRSVIRLFLTKPSFAGLIIVTIALGVGVNTAMFSVVNAVLLRPLPVETPSQIVVMLQQNKDTSEFLGTSYPDFLDFRSQADALRDMIAYQPSLVGLSSDGKAERAVAEYVTGNFFSMLGVAPAIGRLFAPGEGDQLGADNLVVLGYAYWHRRFGSNPGVVGRSVAINGHTFMIIGVAAKTFDGPSLALQPDAYLPLSTAAVNAGSTSFWTNRDIRNLKVLGRLRPDVSLEAAQAALNVVSQRLAQQYPTSDKVLSARLFPELRARTGAGTSGALPFVGTLFLCLAGLVLLVASVNVMNILLVRAIGRQREIAIRSALGATRSVLIRQSLVESIVLALLGGAVGIVLGRFACTLLQSLRSQLDLPINMDLTIDWRVLIYCFTLSLLTGILVGITSASSGSKTNIATGLHEGGRGTSAGGWVRALRNGLVVSQVAISLVLLIVAGLFVRSLGRVRQMKLGFDSDHLLNLTMDPREIGYDEARAKSFYRDLGSRIRALPGVPSASLCTSVPFGYIHETASIFPAGQIPTPGQQPPAIYYNSVDPEYFDNLRITFVKGRQFTYADNQTAPAVAIVNETMAKQLWPHEDAIGKTFALKSATAPLIEVVGITRDAQYVDITDDMEAFFFLPLEQHYISARTLQVRTVGQPESLTTEVETVARSLAPDLPIFDVRTMKDAMNGLNGFFIFRLAAGLAAAFGLLGLALAVVGVYGVVSYDVSMRTQEIGIRMALGAQRYQVLLMILKQGLGLVLIGLSAGLLLTLAVSHGIKSLLIGISSADPVAFGGVSALLACVALAASAVPALRAIRIDPSIALRTE
jgi:predicted permease